MINHLQLKQYAYLMRLHKPIGILLLLWPTLWAIWLASAGHPDGTVLCVFVLGVILMRSAGCVINDFADRHVDGAVSRTRERPLVTKKVSTKAALFLFALLSLLAFSLVFLLNRLTVELAIVGAALTVFYPLMKRFTYLPQFGLGVAFSWGIPMAFAAETGFVSTEAWVVFFAALWWPIIYDTMYAMTDRQDDLQVGIKSTAILFGHADKLWIGLLQILFLFLLVSVGILFHLKWVYYMSLIVVALLFGYQQMLIANRDPARCFKAFLNNHWVGLVIFVGIMLSFLS